MPKSKSSQSTGFHINKVILIAIMIILISLGLYFYRNKTSPKTSSSPTTTGDFQTLDTTQWLTYKSPNYSASAGSTPPIAFSIKYPSDWKPGYDNQTDPSGTYGDGFTFTYNDYQIKIAKGYAPGGNLCESPYIKDIYAEFKLDNSQNKFRRVKAFEGETIKPGTIVFTVCSKNPEDPNSAYGYVSNSEFGKIRFIVPQSYDSSTLNIMENIITSIQKLQ